MKPATEAEVADLMAEAEALQPIRLRRSARPFILPALVLAGFSGLAATAFFLGAVPGNAAWLIAFVAFVPAVGATGAVVLACKSRSLQIDAQGIVQPTLFGDWGLSWGQIENIRVEGGERPLVIFDILARPADLDANNPRAQLLAFSDRGLVAGRYALNAEQLARLLLAYQTAVRKSWGTNR
ncbi:MAG: hypothetical protein ACPGOV_03545 [Magnetovibrionaceae bacterium]